jgi:hypothetical protein
MPFDPNAFTEDMRRRREQQATIAPVDQTQGFAPGQYSGDTSGQPQRPVATAGDLATSAGMFGGSAAATAYGFGGPAITPGMAYDAVGRPMIQSGGRLLEKYNLNPIKAVADVVASKIAPGVIPAQVVKGAAPEIAERINNIIGQLPKGTDVNADQFLRGLTNEDKLKFVQQVEKDGLEKAFKNFQAPKYLDEAGETALKGVQKAFPSGMSKLKTAAGLVGRTAARFAGPVGMAVTAYDLYDLGSEMYDRYKQSQPAAPVAPGTAAAPPMPASTPVAPTGGQAFDMDRRIREEAYRRAMGQQ